MSETTPIPAAAKISMVEMAARAALGGHDLEAFEVLDDRSYQARCRSCGQTVLVNHRGVAYSLLADTCAEGLPS